MASLPAAAQVASNASLKGRLLGPLSGDHRIPERSAVSFAGSMTFDGNGNFTVTGSGYYFNRSCASLAFSASGTYQVYSSGTFSINNPFSYNVANLFGGVDVRRHSRGKQHGFGSSI